ncbi:hypothetical protein BUALT_Bualt04G0057400 [Buddleja alternifolia]|uniref:Leucine-rich repeat-containing N-terminal plant-type domain-containing protein n=1 Tax=Buddleja alternifolia TaxID=168488 RepID=A0AAV6XXH4_9LAMI|nr:hypothetical protein BUALT_Bualt04G0057400 [Buddleja alternifolia]
MAWRTVCVVGIFLAIALCCSPPFPFTYGQITDPQEVDALLAVRRKLKDPNKNLKWSKTRDPCSSNWTGVICYFNDTDGYMQFFPPEWRTLEVEKFWGRKDNFTPEGDGGSREKGTCAVVAGLAKAVGGWLSEGCWWLA